jgi:hypothetical protein
MRVGGRPASRVFSHDNVVNLGYDTAQVKNAQSTAMIHQVALTRTRMQRLRRLPADLASVTATGLLSACAAAPTAKFEPPPSGAPAAVLVNQGGLRAFARFPMVDGKETPSFGGKIRVAPGVHKLHVQCYHFEVTGVVPGLAPYVPVIVNTETKQGWFSLTGSLVANQNYYARCVMVDGKPFGYIAASPDGPPLVGFE